MNPMNSNHQAINPGMPQNEVAPSKMRTFNKFPMSYDHKLTARYGDITPFFVFDSWSEDKVPFASFHELRNYTLTSVFQERLKMYKDYFLVPMKAILPRTWDYYIANPTQGEDVPSDSAPYFDDKDLTNFINQYRAFADENFRNLLNEGSLNNNTDLELFIKYSFVLENLFSNGGLLSLLGCKLNKYINLTAYGLSLDNHIQSIYNQFKELISEIPVVFPSLDKEYIYVSDDVVFPDDRRRVSFHRMLELMRDNSDWYFKNRIDVDSNFFSSALVLNIQPFIQGLSVNVSRLAAYQIACAHFMSQDNVDSIYSADLYRSLLETDFLLVNQIATFEMNGVTHLYDVFSKYILSWVFRYLSAEEYSDGSSELVTSLNAKLAYLFHLTTFRKSLKFGNYFTGSRPRPLAVGDVNAPVVNGEVSAIDITKNIAMQRFLNAVNKTGRKLSEYSQKILGGYVAPVNTDPKYLARDTIVVGSQEVENTSNDNTGKVVTNLRSEQSKYAFECEVSEPSIILGVVSFECKPTYSNTIDRHFLHKDRFDMFNPYFQNIGDQEIYNAEKGLGYSKSAFAYQLRNMEYKQRFSIASGGYVEYLPAWSFIVDNNEGTERNETNISSEFIRSSNADFDRFYSSLSGNTLSSYFHFNIWFFNECTPVRNMQYSPTIL